MTLEFDFGKNWADYSAAHVNSQRLQDAVFSLRRLLDKEKLSGQTFLDIGCGSGLFTIAAAECEAGRAVGVDVNPTAVEVCQANLARLAPERKAQLIPEFQTGSVLDPKFVEGLGLFDIVYAWGSLHHTGAMWQAIANAASRVKPDGGTLVVAIYNYHWSAPVWKQIKYVYNLSHPWVKTLFNYVFGSIIYLTVWATTGQSPTRKERGMDFWYDVVDWLGGYPYEYARAEQILDFLQPRGFTVVKVIPPKTPTGCVEYVFRRGPG